MGFGPFVDKYEFEESKTEGALLWDKYYLTPERCEQQDSDRFKSPDDQQRF